MKEIAPLRLRISGNLIRELGEESVSNANVALMELIKNAYDAEAKCVTVSVKDGSAPSKARLVIEDNGMGMGYQDITEKWAVIASPHKRVEQTSPNMKRILVGAKGIGRLAAESLGAKTVMSCQKKGGTKGHRVEFNWDCYPNWCNY